MQKWLGMLLSLATVAMAGCSGGSPSEQPKAPAGAVPAASNPPATPEKPAADKPAGAAQQTNPAPTAAALPVKVATANDGTFRGKTIGDVDVAIVNFDEWDMLGSATSDGVFGLVRLVMVNKGKEAVAFDEKSFKVIDINAKKEYAVTPKPVEALKSGNMKTLFTKLEPGQKIEANVAFDLPKGSNMDLNWEIEIQAGNKTDRLPLKIVQD